MIVEVARLERDALAAASALLGRACPFDRGATIVAEEKLFGASPHGPGAACGAWGEGRLVGVAVVSARWLRLLAVDPLARGRGVGTALLTRAAAHARAGGERVLRTAGQPGNYLTPGADVRDHETLAWLERRGFARVGARESWRVALAGNPLVSLERAAAFEADLRTRGYGVRRAAAADAPALVPWIATHFTDGWAFEVGRALELEPPGVYVAAREADGTVVAFAAHDGNNRGLGEFGPAGTLPAYRGQGLGAALLVRSLLDVAAAGHADSVIPWVGPGEHYRRAVGAVPDRRFAVLERAFLAAR